jgi:hypothetical protein
MFPFLFFPPHPTLPYPTTFLQGLIPWDPHTMLRAVKDGSQRLKGRILARDCLDQCEVPDHMFTGHKFFTG